jgi:hypothetical protein
MTVKAREAATISEGNSKLKKIPNVSLTPIKSCPAICRTTCGRKGECYALKAYRQYTNVRLAWDSNLDNALYNRAEFFATIHSYLAKRKPRFFRWHVAGDIPDQDYLDRMYELAEWFPDTKFLCFTKNHGLSFRRAPVNLTIVLSMWPGMEDIGPEHLPRAWMDDGTEDRVPLDAIECPGQCDECGMCWSLRKIGCDVVFEKH